MAACDKAEEAVPVIRPVEPTDRQRLAAAFERLSVESRLQRYLGPKPVLPERELTELVSVDHDKREALVAVNCADGSIVGVARFGTWPGSTAVAELSVEIADKWQGRGIGAGLAGAIIRRARTNGIRRLTATALGGNFRALALLRKFGFSVTGWSRGTAELELDLTSAGRCGAA
jgi:acetyltransferase